MTENSHSGQNYSIDIRDFTSAKVITSHSIKLAGSMIEDRKTHDLFGLQCIHEIKNNENENTMTTCKKIRPIYYSVARDQLIAFGPVYTISSKNPEKPTDSEVSTALKSLGNDLILTWNSQDKIAEKNRAIAVTSPPAIGGLGMFAMGASFATAFPIILAGTVVSIPLALLVDNNNNLLMKGKIGATISNQEGWNWSNKSHKINHKKFAFFIKTIETQFYNSERLGFRYNKAKQLNDLNDFLQVSWLPELY
jgi:hypothetical protein